VEVSGTDDEGRTHVLKCWLNESRPIVMCELAHRHQTLRCYAVGTWAFNVQVDTLKSLCVL